MLLTEEAKKIISRMDIPDFDDILRTSIGKYGYDSYNNCAHKTSYQDITGLETFCKLLYCDWGRNLINNIDLLDPIAKNVAITLKDNNFFWPKNVIERNKGKCKTPFYNFFLSGYDKYFKGTGVRPASLQNGISIIKEDNMIPSDSFFHVYGAHLIGKRVDNIEARLYLNLEAKNIPSFAIEAYKKCKEAKLPFYFKFSLRDNRNDPFLFYTSLENMPKYIKIIEEIKKEHPEYLSGTEKISNKLGKINGYIGFGDEPIKTGNLKESYSSARDILFKNIRYDLREKTKNLYANTMTPNDNIDSAIEAFVISNINSGKIVISPQNNNAVKFLKQRILSLLEYFVYEGKPIESFNINNEIFKGLVDINPQTLLKHFKPKSFNLTEIRGELAKRMTFSSNDLTSNEINLHTIIQKILVKGIEEDLTDPNISNESKKVLKEYLNSIREAPNNAQGRALVQISVGNFLKYGTIFLNSSKYKESFQYDHLLLDVYEHLLGKDKVKSIIKENCDKKHISQDYICFNQETIEQLKNISRR